ncbi:MAG: hypothetical protein Q8J93_13970, partial [Xanthomonadales bacterium]|nr:hypothetical protein [Xanthomonadales bacterium]
AAAECNEGVVRAANAVATHQPGHYNALDGFRCALPILRLSLDLGGLIRRAQGIQKINPAQFVDPYRVPMRVIHGLLGYRVPFKVGRAAFTVSR